ncbi:hypothetical protein AB0M68_29230 [Streptomyces sp. NPDC051453]|uniref:hypothetical protein n=1 Tax=Streptomyces sp. NPDC051453 TaxID=3154941 RepID=UPI00342AD245
MSPESTSQTAADDLAHSVRLVVDTFGGAPGADWGVKAGPLEWDCWETAEHLADDLFAYAAQLGPSKPPLDAEVPFDWTRRRPDGPANVIFANRDAGPAGLLQVLDASGALLVAMVRTAAPETRAHHVFGLSDPAGFGAMGVVETLVHAHDIAEGLGLEWTPPAAVCARALARLFPDAPRGDDPWRALLWATGRGELPSRERLTSWRWNAEVR